MVRKAFLISSAVTLLWVSLSQAREGKVFFPNGRWLKGDIQIQKESSNREIVVIALKSGSITLDKSQVKNIVYLQPFAGSPKQLQSPKSKVQSQKSENIGYRTSDIGRSFDPYIQEASSKNQLDPELIKAVIKQESNFKTDNVSRKGAKGLMQLMPETAKTLGVQDLFDPRENIHAGTRYLRAMLEHFNWDIEVALAAYNAGPGAVKKYGAIPPYQETEDYVRKVLATYRSYLNRNQLVAFKDKKGKLVITDLPYYP